MHSNSYSVQYLQEWFPQSFKASALHCTTFSFAASLCLFCISLLSSGVLSAGCLSRRIPPGLVVFLTGVLLGVLRVLQEVLGPGDEVGEFESSSPIAM